MGARGETSTPVRNFVVRGIRDYIAGLSGADLKDFREILANVEIQRMDLNKNTPAK
jgi:DNA-binding protein Fis